MNLAIKIVSKTLMTKISHISWGGYEKGGGYDKGEGLRQRLLRYMFCIVFIDLCF